MAKIALIAPGCRGNQWGSTIEQDAEKIVALGFEATFLEDSVSKTFPFPGSDLANTPEQRARQIINFAQDPEITAMWAVSGGESAPEVSKLLVEYGLNPAKYIEEHQVDPLSGQKLDYVIGAESGFSQNRPLPTIVGMSDVSSIQIALAKFGFPSLYANVALLGSEFLTKAAESISDTKAVNHFNGLIKVSNGELPERISGPVYATVGGGLDSSLRTDWQPNFLPGTILMVEDVSGYQTLTQRLREARNSDALEKVQAIIIGNAASAGSKLSDGIPPEVKAFSDEIGLPVFLIPDNQFGHLKDKEPTPIANFGIIEIDTSAGSATVSGQGSHDLARSYQQQNFGKSGKRKVLSEDAQISTFTKLETIPETLELSPLNQAATKQKDLTSLENVVGGSTKKLPSQLNANGKTLLIVDGNWVSLGRELTDRYNKGDLDGVSSIVVGIDNPYPELKSRLDGATTEIEKVAVGLSFLAHPDFKFTVAEDGRYICDAPFLDIKDGDLKTFAESSFIPWLKAHDIKLTPEDILADGTKFSIPIDATKNSEIIAKVESPEVVNQKVKHCEKRIEYFAGRYMEFSDPQRGVNQAGDMIDHEIPVFMVDRNSLPKEMKEGLFSAESLSVRVKINEHQEEEIKEADKQSFVEKLGLHTPYQSQSKNMRDSKATSPLIIYIAETDHGDTSYSSVTEKIIKECDAKGLATSVFSEFGNKELGLGSEDEKNVAGYFPKEQVNKFVNERCVPMGNVFNRFTKLIPEIRESFSEDITPSQIFDQRRSYVDNPETLKFLEAEITVRQQNQKEGIGEVGNQNSAGKNGADSKKFWENANAFVQTITHQEMAQDVTRMISGQEDVVIMIAGAPHIYGLDKALGSTFQNCEKLVIGNFQEFEVDLSNLESIENAKRLCGKESCESVGSVIGFEVSSDKQAVVPDVVTTAISKQVERETFVERLDLKKPEEQKKSWVERICSDDPTKGKSLGGSNEL